MNTQHTDITDDPYKTFASWLEEAKLSEINDPNAMNLATADGNGRPSNRMVLLNGIDERGFVFYTNEGSRKGQDIIANPYAALCFHWKTLRRQVRIEGRVDIVSEAEADAYYNSRPRQSRIGAWASQQSRPLANYQDLKDAVAKYEKEFEGRDDIPRPAYWKGFRVVPDKIEFWIDGEFRLHRRYIFIPDQNTWTISMVNP